jgi:hypothetical protein
MWWEAMGSGIVRFRSLLCLVQCSLPLVSGVVLCLCLRKDGVGNLKVTMSWTMEACCVPGTWSSCAEDLQIGHTTAMKVSFGL